MNMFIIASHHELPVERVFIVQEEYLHLNNDFMWLKYLGESERQFC